MHPTRPAPPFRKTAAAGALAGLALLGAALLLYRKAMSLPLLDLDSFRLVLSRPALRDPASLRHLWTPLCFDVFGEGYRPLSVLARFAGLKAFGVQPAGHRLVQLLLSFANALWVAAIGARLLGGRRWAWIAAVFYFLRTTPSPMGGLADVCEPLATFFCLAAALFHLRSCGRQGSPWHLPATLAAYALALLSQESCVLLPALLLAHAMLFLPVDEPEVRAKVLVEQAALWTLAGLYLAWLAWGVRAWSPASRLGQTLPPSGLDGLLDLASAWLRVCTPAGAALMVLAALLLLLGQGVGAAQLARWAGLALAWSALGLQRGPGQEAGRLALSGAGISLWLGWLAAEAELRPFTRPLARAAAGGLLLWGAYAAWAGPVDRLRAVPETVLNETLLASDPGPGPRPFPPSFSATMLSMPLLARQEPALAELIGQTLRESLSLSQSGLIMEYFSDPALLRDPGKARQALQLLEAGGFDALAARLSSERYFLIGKALLEQKDYAPALSAFREALSRDPGHSLACLGMAQTHFAMGDTASAAEQLDACASESESRPRSPLVVELSPAASLVGAARTAASLGRTAEALDAYGRALAAPGLDWGFWRCDVLAERGTLLAGLKRYGEAGRDFEAASSSSTWLWPGRAGASRSAALLKSGARAAFDRGNAAAAAGDPRTAVEELAAALQAFPGYTEALLLRGTEYSALGQYEAAIADFDRALLREGLGPAMAARLLAARGSAFLARRKDREAADDLRQALRVGPPGWPGRAAVLGLLADPRLSSRRKK